ncbi:DUF4132 domain-containing protein [Paludisphaera soli]|uniref:DUF4132 domain-containing protein n=1 Tax=Paludisphaera soli TaxID=2712865 RepID=UPI0013EA38FC|nr:DUF4132 domain-containing protein [Paludisphaera soli]
MAKARKARDDPGETVARLVRELAEVDARSAPGPAVGTPEYAFNLMRGRGPLWEPLRTELRRAPALPDATLLALLRWLATTEAGHSDWPGMAVLALGPLGRRAEAAPLDDDLTAALRALRDRLASRPAWDGRDRKASDRLDERLAALMREDDAMKLIPGEAWSDAAIADLEAMEPARRAAWRALFASCQEAGAGGGKPTARWLKAAAPLVDAVGRDEFRARFLAWAPLVDRPRTGKIPARHRWATEDWAPEAHQQIPIPPHVDLLKGLAWCAAVGADAEVTRALAALAESSFRKLPGFGPRSIALGNAAAVALGMTPGLEAAALLAVLRKKLKGATPRKALDKALAAIAARNGLARDEVEDRAVPTFGLVDGVRRETLGEHVAELAVDGPHASLRWSKGGKAIKSVPAIVKQEHGDRLRALRAEAKEAGALLAAHRQRLEASYLARRTWNFPAWREHVLDHPLVGAIARRLIWTFDADGRAVAGAWLDDRIIGVDDAPLEGLGEATKVALWHPIDRPVNEVTAWRDRFDRHRVRQPFKQAHREVYVLTDAERATRVYSNRFAAHVLRQHQFHALAEDRGWADRLRVNADVDQPPTRLAIPEWNLRAEFWVDPTGDLAASGVFLHLAADQVRFYDLDAGERAQPIPLDRIPPLVLSEVFRDVDLFVGVASVGNDPSWADGGPEGRFVDYWQSYSFGDLSANGRTRKAVLERLIPRLKIAPRCSFADRFLVVRGDLRTYKIHLGSGNILMEPNDQYLCIVPKRGGEPTGDGVFLPFEGDATLSIILSKALMLADDRKISDSTITSQIRRG